jgi:hypothetical protein
MIDTSIGTKDELMKQFTETLIPILWTTPGEFMAEKAPRYVAHQNCPTSDKKYRPGLRKRLH